MVRFSCAVIVACVMGLGVAGAAFGQIEPGQNFYLENLSAVERADALAPPATSEEPPAQAEAPAPADAASAAGLEFLLRQVDNEKLTLIVLATLAIVSLLIVVVALINRGAEASDVVNGSGLTLIIFGTIILVLVVETHEQLTAAIGVLGAIAGYLFGSIRRELQGG